MSNRFVVDMSGIKLSKDQSRQIEASIQQAVLKSVADIRLDTDLRLRFPREWIGIILNPEIGSLADLDKQIGERFRF